jgi:hypothetical protein
MTRGCVPGTRSPGRCGRGASPPTCSPDAAGSIERFAEAGALTLEDLAAVRQQVRARVLRWFARAGHLD